MRNDWWSGWGYNRKITNDGQLEWAALVYLTYSMVQSPSWEANWFAASQEIPRISRNPKVHYSTQKRPPPVSILGKPNPVHIPTSHLLEIHPNIHPSTSKSPQWSLSLRFPQQDPIHSPPLTHTRHMPSPSHSSRFYHQHNIGWGVQALVYQTVIIGWGCCVAQKFRKLGSFFGLNLESWTRILVSCAHLIRTIKRAHTLGSWTTWTRKRTHFSEGRDTGCLFYRVCEHGSCHGTSRNMQTFCAKKLPCSGDTIRGSRIKRNTVVSDILVAACT